MDAPEILNLPVSEIVSCLRNLLDLNDDKIDSVLTRFKNRAIKDSEPEDGSRPKTTFIWLAAENCPVIVPEGSEALHHFVWLTSKLTNNVPQQLIDRVTTTHLILCAKDLPTMRKMMFKIKTLKIRFVEMVLYNCHLDREIFQKEFPSHSRKLYSEPLSKVICLIKEFCRSAFPSKREAKSINWTEAVKNSDGLDTNTQNAEKPPPIKPSRQEEDNARHRKDRKTKKSPSSKNRNRNSSCNPAGPGSKDDDDSKGSGAGMLVKTGVHAKDPTDSPLKKRKRPNWQEMKQFYEKFPNFAPQISGIDPASDFQIPRKQSAHSHENLQRVSGETRSIIDIDSESDSDEETSGEDTGSGGDDDLPPKMLKDPIGDALQPDHNQFNPADGQVQNHETESVKNERNANAAQDVNPSEPEPNNNVAMGTPHPMDMPINNAEPGTPLPVVSPIKLKLVPTPSLTGKNKSLCEQTRVVRLMIEKGKKKATSPKIKLKKKHAALNANAAIPYTPAGKRKPRYYQLKSAVNAHACGLGLGECIPMHAEHWNCLGLRRPPSPNPASRNLAEPHTI